MKKLVVSTGAGISAESGMMTYRDAGGLWDNYPVMEVASAEGFAANPPLIHQFYSNMRKKMTEGVVLEPSMFCRILFVWRRMSSGSSLPVSGSMGIMPERYRKPPALTAWE